MRLGKYELTEWRRSYGGWFRYNIDYVANPLVAICLYHNLIETLEDAPTISLPNNTIYDSSKKIIWTVRFNHAAFELTQLYYDLYAPKEYNEDEIKKKVDKFIMRIHKLIIFS